MTAGVVAAVLLGLGQSAQKQPNPVLGRALQPLAAYRIVLPGDAGRAHVATMQLPDLGRPGHTTTVQRVAAFTLHVRYANVRQVAGRWQLDVTAPEGGSFNVDTTRGEFFDVVVDGHAAHLFFVGGTQGPGPDHGTNFAFAGGPTRAGAVTLARTLTTSVRVG